MPYPDIFEVPVVDDPLWQAGDGRTWIKVEGDDPMGFLGCAMLGGFTQASSDVTPVWCPDPNRRRAFVQVDKVRGTPSRGEVPISMYLSKMNFLQQMQAKGCALHLDARYGECGYPSDPDDWEHILRFCEAFITNLSSTDLTQREGSDEVDITATLSFKEMYNLWPMTAQNVPIVLLGDLNAVKFCDRVSCGECGETPSQGCNVVHAVSDAIAGTPYLITSEDGGDAWTAYAITVWAGGEDARDVGCLPGRMVFVVTEDRPVLAYTLDNGTTWVETAVGFLPGCSGTAIHVLGNRHVWIAATNGTIYFTADPSLGVDVQENAGLTASDLRDIHFANTRDGYCVGDNNTFLTTTNGGTTWQAGTGPAVGQDIDCVWAISTDTMAMVIVGTRNGELWQSFDAGVTWTQRILPGVTGTVNIPAVTGCGCYGMELFVLVEAGTYLTPTAGQLFRSIDGGINWTEIVLPTNLGVEDVACCSPNKVIVVGSTLAGGNAFVSVAEG